MSCLKKPVDIKKEFKKMAMQFHENFNGLKVAN